jgi:hypothetical protein
MTKLADTITLARWMAKRDVKSIWQSWGRRSWDFDASDLARAAGEHFNEHRDELLAAAWEQLGAKLKHSAKKSKPQSARASVVHKSSEKVEG